MENWELAEFRAGALYLTVGRLALTGPVHFEVKFPISRRLC